MFPGEWRVCQPTAVFDEISWQLAHMNAQVRAALQQLPPLGENSAGPLGSGLLASGILGSIIRKIQAAMGNISPEEGVRYAEPSAGAFTVPGGGSPKPRGKLRGNGKSSPRSNAGTCSS